MIVGTAGHIDHGKTTLVRALTGVDTDRLPEEKKRGISIELGYAFLDVPGRPEHAADGVADRIGFIDVPGHERLVHTMLAGATGIDYALLLVAADDGVMPQTREHLAVLSLLGIGRGAVLVTKADRADPAAAMAQVHALLAGTPLAAAPVLPVSAHTGLGIDALKALLFSAALHTPPHAGVCSGTSAFRLAIDRVFTLDGVGTVATGTVRAGVVAVGDALTVAPQALPVRVRSLHAQNRAVQRARAGQRCAVGLAGVSKDALSRGDWLVAPAAALSTARIDARLTLWHAEPRPLRSGTAVLVHLGAAAVAASVAVLDGDALAPGASGRVQLVLRAPVGAWVGDRVVLRDAAASRTIAGGTVLDPFGPVRYRRTPERLAALDALAGAGAAAVFSAGPSHGPDAVPGDLSVVAALLAVAPHGVDLQRLSAALGRPAAERPLPAGALQAGDWALGAAQGAAAAAALQTALAAFHAAHPDAPGPDTARLRRLAAPRLPAPLWSALLTTLQADARVAVRGAFVQLPDHAVRLSAAEQRIAQKVAPLLATAGFEGAWARDLARSTNEPEPLLRTTLARLAQQGELHQIVRDLYLAPATLQRLAAHVRAVAGADGHVTAAAFRDATGLGRKRAIQILEYFDSVGLLRRVGDAHRLRADSALFPVENA